MGCIDITNGPVFQVTTGINITISSHPSPSTVCAGTPATFSAAATGTTNIGYRWQYATSSTGTFFDVSNGSNYSNVTTATLSVNTTGNFGNGYYYRCRITGDSAPTAYSNAAQLIVNAAPAAPTGSNVSICGAGTVTLTAAGGSAGQYRWYTVATGGTPISGQTNATYSSTVTVTTPYYVALNNGICEGPRKTINAIVNTLPPPPIAGGTIVCHTGSGGDAYLYASGASNGNYRWYTTETGGSPISGEVNSLYKPFVTVTTTFYVSIVSGACETVRSPKTAEVRLAPPKPTITANKPIIDNAVTACPGELILSGPPGYEYYLWSPVEEGGRELVITESGAYAIRVTQDECDSEYSDEVTVTIDATNCVNAAPVITASSVSIPINGIARFDLSSILSDPDNNLDISTLSIDEQPQSGAEAVLNEGVLEIDYSTIEFAGTDHVTIGVCDYFNECVQQELEIIVIGDLIVYNGISPNNDGQNDFWFLQFIDLIEETKNNKVSIYNRWGDEVFSVSNYNNVDRVFKGLNKNGNELPSGTYFYKIEFQSGKKTETGYLALKR